MLSQSQIKHITALKIKKFRAEYRQFVAEGSKLVMDILCSDYVIAGIYASGDWILAHIHQVRAKNIPVYETLPREMDRISGLSTPSQVLAVVNMPPAGSAPFGEAPGEGLIIALDNIRDPGNLGTIIRIADWFGIGIVICSESCVDIYNPKVVQATMGSIARVATISCNLENTIATLSGLLTPPGAGRAVPVYGAFLEGDSIYSLPPCETGIIVIGNESHGISPGLEPYITRRIFIPSYASDVSGSAESLNASVAAAIICAEFRRKQIKN